MISGHVLRAIDRRAAEYYNMSINTLLRIRTILNTERDIYQELGGMPKNIDELIAARLKKNVATIQTYKRKWRAAHPIPLDATVGSNQTQSGSARKYIDTIEPVDYTFEDREQAKTLKNLFYTVFDELHISNIDRRILLDTYGIEGEPLNKEEAAIVAQLSEREIKNRLQKIKYAVSKSATARLILMQYVQE
ncbi:MAG TPA: hypothetical protein VLE73_00210 [Candidatus Saccharimonadales bacterium]|nr:hypothetical protein [Candidatus Saccharimonadales bacterium]